MGELKIGDKCFYINATEIKSRMPHMSKCIITGVDYSSFPLFTVLFDGEKIQRQYISNFELVKIEEEIKNDEQI